MSGRRGRPRRLDAAALALVEELLARGLGVVGIVRELAARGIHVHRQTVWRYCRRQAA